MVDQVKQFVAEADWKSLAKQFSDFNEAKQVALRSVMNQCAKDFEFPLKEKDVEHENFNYFALCLRSNVAMNPSLNGSQGVRSAVLGWNY
jgi:hypothetical protein